MTRSELVVLVKRTLLVFGLLLSGMAPVAAPVAAQVPPSITFSPSSVAAGGSVTVSGSNWGGDCPSVTVTVKVDLYDSTGQYFVANLGTTEPFCNTFSQQFTVPATVPPNQYRVKGTRLPEPSQIVALSQGLLTVNSAGVVISGIAQCPNATGGNTILNFAQVDLFSGSTHVAQTFADAQGRYSFSGASTSAIYQVRYQSNADVEPTITCGTFADTDDGDVNLQNPPPCPGQSWDTAAALNPQGTPITAILCSANGSIWRTVAVQPGQQVSVTVSNIGPHTRLALFKDLRKDLQTLLANPTKPDLRQLDASMNGMSSSPWTSSPWTSSPWTSSPWTSSPWTSSPWTSSPWTSSPWTSSPFDTTQLCQSLHLNVDTQTCSGAYMTVQVQDLMAWSANGQVTKNTFDLSGDLYIRIYNDDASFDPSDVMTITATVVGTCGVPPQSGTAPVLQKTNSSFLASPTTTTVPGGKKTLIFTNTARLLGPNGKPLTDASNATLLSQFRTTANNFAASPLVGGQVVDLATDNGLAQDYLQWDTPPFPSCPAAANVVASALHDLINAYRTQSGSVFQYVTILGGHTVVPYHVAPDVAELEPENGYNPGLLDVSKSAATLGDAYVMTDNYYISFTPINRLESEISLPDANMGIGRLVEFPADIIAGLQAFLDTNGVAKPTSALVTGYTFTKDLATFEASELSQAGLNTDQLISDTWTAPDLRAKLFGAATPGIIAVNWHARSNEAVAADYATRHPTTISSSEIASLPTSDTRFKNALVISIGCHLAYPLLDQDVIPNPTSPPQFVTDSRAFTETLQARGAMVLGNSGYGYGDTDFVGYSEELLALVTQELGDGATNPVPLGLALTNAKRIYLQNSGATTGVDKKSIEELTFYGPPMWSIQLPSHVDKPDRNPLNVGPAVADDGHSLFAGTVTPQYTLTQRNLTAASGGASFFEADHQPTDQAAGTQQIPYQTVLPFKAFDVSSNTGTARGVALINADYVDTPGSSAAIDLPTTEVSGTRPPWPTPGFWPLQTFGLNELVGQELVTTPVQWQSNDGVSGTVRKYNNTATTLRVYYSALGTGAAFAAPASIGDIKLSLSQSNPQFLHVDVTVSGAIGADIFDVLVNVTDPPASGGPGKWRTCSIVAADLTDTATTSKSCNGVAFPITVTVPGSFTTHYAGDIDPSIIGATNPADLKLAIQAVTGTGLVSTRTNDGLYYSLAPDVATIGNPKATTSINLVSPPSPTTYGLNATFSATLSSNRANCSTANQPLTFNVGSQVQTVRTGGGGTATATFNMLEVPNTYPVLVTFNETPTCLGSSSGTPAKTTTEQKEATTLTFGATAYVAILKDATNTPMRERWVYFNFKGTSNGGAAVNATRAAQTDANGIAQLHGMAVPAGTYTATATFPGTIPIPGGSTIQLNDPLYLQSTTGPKTVTADRTAPTCTLSGVNYNSSGQAISADVVVQDTGSGLASVNPTELNNGTFTLLSPSTYTAGFTGKLTVRIVKTTVGQSTQFTLQVLDVAGNMTSCDPELVQVGKTKDLPRRVRMSVNSSETQATIYNGTPGVTELDIKVNNKSVEVDDLQSGEVRTVDLSDLMGGRRDQDTVVIMAKGKPGGTAVVLFSDEGVVAP